MSPLRPVKVMMKWSQPGGLAGLGPDRNVLALDIHSDL